VAAIPEQQGRAVRFEFIVKKLQGGAITLTRPARIRLSWYQNPPVLHVGDEWQLSVRLKIGRGFWNQGSFDYEAWLFERGIRAVGYVENNAAANRLLTQQSTHFIVHQVREKLASAIAHDLADYPLEGLIGALAVGDRNDITQSQWQVLRATGTNHLFAIAGLHIGFVTGMIYFLINFLWRRSQRLSLYFPAPQAASLAALIAAFFYSALAGFSLPTQRAVIMIAVFLIATLLRKNLSTLKSFCWALIIILIIEPLAVLSTSFWLSFAAVALIIYGVSGRFKKQSLAWRWLRLQWVLAIGLLPLGLLFFQESSLVGFVANAIAIPWVGFIVLPLCVLAALVWFVWPHLSSYLFILAEHALEFIWLPLNYLANLNGLQWNAYLDNKWILIAACVAVIVWLAPRGFPARYLAIIWGFPLLFWMPQNPSVGEVRFTLLDVGEGYAAVIQTPHHVLVFDAGPDSTTGSSAGSTVVLPFLQAVGINRIDTFIVSATGAVNIVGTSAILAQLPVTQVMTTAPGLFKPGLAVPCSSALSWNWDGVNFRMLSPDASKKPNAKDACLLQVSNGVNSVILTDATPAILASYLLPQVAAGLPAPAILAIPFRGSNTQSIQQVVQALHPQYLFFSVGNNARDDFSSMGDFCKNLNTIFYTTKDEGAISVKFTAEKNSLVVESYRQQHPHFW